MTNLTLPPSARPGGPAGPVLKTSPRCPTCGRPDAVTFRACVFDNARLGTPPVVCIRCAPRPPRP